MKIILIDPELKEVKQIELERKDGETITELHRIMNCEIFTVPLIMDNQDGLYCDDEGLMKENHLYTFEAEDGTVFKFVGKSLLIGTDEEGDSVDVKSKLQDIANRVDFPVRNKTDSI